MERNEALKLVKANVTNKNLVKHMLAVEAIMRRLAKHFGEDEEKWGLVGLVHDLDYEQSDMNTHGLKTAEMLEGKVDKELLDAIRAHNYENNGFRKPETKMEKALIAADAVSGLAVAAALVMPDKKISQVRVETMLNKFKQKDFARRVSRENIRLCEELGLTLEEFFKLTLEALQGISEELGL